MWFQAAVPIVELGHELLVPLREGAEADKIILTLGLRPLPKRFHFRRVRPTRPIAHYIPQQWDLGLRPVALAQFELNPPLAGRRQEQGTMFDVPIDDVLVGVAFIGFRSDIDVVNEDRHEFVFVPVPEPTKGRVHQPLEDPRTLLGSEVQHRGLQKPTPARKRECACCLWGHLASCESQWTVKQAP